MMRWTPDKAAYKLFHEASIALAQIESNGIRVDTVYLAKAMADTTNKIAELKKELKSDPIYRKWRKRFRDGTKLSSSQQLAEVIFDIVGHPRPVTVKSRSEKTDDYDERKERKAAADEAVFADVNIPFVKSIFKMRKLEKALTTYLRGIEREVVDGFIHPSFNLNLVVTYRSSSNNPNFQNIPKRNPEMAEIIRRCYIARDERQLGEVDFSGAEVRVSACYNKDPVLIRYIKDKSTDMHRDAACDLFMLTPDQVDKKGPRDGAKNQFVFPQFYGSVYFQCAPALWNFMLRRGYKIVGTDKLVKDHLAERGITELGDCDPQATTKPGTFVHHVKEVERLFWEERFTKYTQWKKDYYNEYQRTGGFKMYTGFTCWGVFKRNDVLNYSVQGSAFHCLLWSLVQLQKWLVKNKMRTKIVGQIHDSIVADIHPDERDEFLAKCKQVMTVDLLKHWDWLIVPMEVEADIAPVGKSWHEMEAVKIQ